MLNETLQELKENWLIENFNYNIGLSTRAYAADYKPTDYIRAQVPTSVQNALFEAGKIPDPYVEYNASRIVWVERKEWWFYNDFETPEYKKEQRVFIRFEGITYRAEVWVNGVQAGIIEGMFRIDEFDVTDYLNKNAAGNRLTLRIRTQENAVDDIDGASPLRIRTQGPVAQNMYRWNWCPHMVCVGIWRPVKIVLKSAMEVEALRIRTLNVDLQGRNGIDIPCANAQVQVEWSIRNSSSEKKEFEISFSISGETFKGCIFEGHIKASIKAGETKVIIKKLNIKNARLWWPNGTGNPELHKIKSTLRTSSGLDVQENNEVFGIRKFTWERNEEEDWVLEASGSTERPWSMLGEMYKWTLLVNGWKVFMKGSNWVMLDSMLRLEKWRYDRQLSLFKSGGLNFIRIWGGSLAETDEFYDICDRYGIICWQEFWLACGDYPAMNHDAFIRCVKDTVKRLINRTCLVHYSGGNEYEPDNMENKVLVDKIAAAVVEIDPEREFRRGSPYKGDRHGGLVMTPFVTRNKYLDILYGDKRITLMRSEVATGRSTPMLSSFEKMIPEKSRWPIDEKMWRNFFGVPCEFIGFANEYDSADDYEHAIYANYLWHGQLCRVNMEYCRTRMYRCSGNLNWQFNVPWPCMHREIVDMWGVPKPAYYYHVNSSKPVLISMDLEKYLWNPGEVFNPDLYVVNELHALKEVVVKIKLFSVDMKVLFEKEFRIELKENKAFKLGELDYKIPAELSQKTVFVKAELYHENKLLHENLYWFAVSNNNEPAAKIELDGIWQRDDASEITLPGNDMAIKNSSFEYVFQKKNKSFDLENQSGCLASSVSNQDMRYKKKFTVPEILKNMDLEFFTPGFEASDDVYVNGHKIGSHELKGVTLDRESFCFVPWGKDKSSIEIDPESEYMFYSDPLSLPKLKARFYDIPKEILNREGENKIELVIKTYYQKAISNPMEIRPRTANRDAVSKYLKNGIFYSDLRQMSEAKIDVKVEKNEIYIKNISSQMAFSVIIELIPQKTDIAIPLEDNSISIMPGDEKIIRPMAGGTFDFPACVRVYGWNISKMDFNVDESRSL